MLNGGGINPDGLSLDLQFAADKTLTARRGPTPDFTRGSTATFVGSDGLIQSAAINIPRFDHDPTSPFACRGLLIEESRTNICLQSENFGTTWTAISLNTTGTPAYLNVATAPDGATTADKLIATAANSTHQFRQDVTLVSGTSYTISVYFKAAETTLATISVFGVANGSGDWVSYFNISAASPAVGSFNGFSSTSLVDVGNGWRRCSATFTATASGTLSVRLGGALSTNIPPNVYAGDGTSGFFLWGAQLEAGSFATSYIPTTTGTLARGADVCNITGGNFNNFYNQSEGTLFLNAVPPFESQLAYPLMVNTTGNSQAHRIARTNELGVGSKRWRALTTTSAGIEAVITTSGNITTTNVKAAYAFKLNDNAFAVNNVLVGTDTTVAMPNPTSMRIGGNDGVDVLNGHIAAVRFYKKRLPNAKLQALTV